VTTALRRWRPRTGKPQAGGDAIEAGSVGPWQHTNARRSSVRKPYSPRRRRPDVPPVPTTPTTASLPVSVASDSDERDVLEHVDWHVGLTAVRELADIVRTAKTCLARARSSRAELAQIAADLGKTLNLVHAMKAKLPSVNHGLQSELSSVGDGTISSGS
jgi:hypothetical protein